MPAATIVCGSGNLDGVSRRMCDIAESVLSLKGYDVFFFDPARMQISHCMDCNGCKTGCCIISDDMDMIYDAFSQSDIVVFSAPIHFSGPSSVIKTVMDRFQKCWFEKGAEHSKRFLAMLCGGSPEPNFQMTERIFKAFCITARLEYLGALEIPHTDAGVPDLEENVRSFISDMV